MGGVRVSGPDPEHRSYRSFASFSDPDGNGWLFQEITTRLPGRIDSAATTFASANDLASAFRRAEAAHGEHEKRIGRQRDANWPDWYGVPGPSRRARSYLVRLADDVALDDLLTGLRSASRARTPWRAWQ